MGIVPGPVESIKAFQRERATRMSVPNPIGAAGKRVIIGNVNAGGRSK